MNPGSCWVRKSNNNAPQFKRSLCDLQFIVNGFACTWYFNRLYFFCFFSFFWFFKHFSHRYLWLIYWKFKVLWLTRLWWNFFSAKFVCVFVWKMVSFAVCREWICGYVYNFRVCFGNLSFINGILANFPIRFRFCSVIRYV